MRISALFVPLAALALAAPAASAQGSPNVPLDDPRLPLIEHLIARGTIADPSPFVRPFRRADAVRVLAAADTLPDTPDGKLVHSLREAFTDLTAERWWGLEARVGGEAYTHARRDPLHPLGPGGVMPYGELRLEAVFGPLVLVTRPAVEPRLPKDPDWFGRKDLKVAGRMNEAYLAAQFSFGSVFFGQYDQNWGPLNTLGLALSNYAYPRTAFGFDIGGRDVRLQAEAAQLHDETDSTGQTIHRYFFGHRLAVRASDRLQLALWETAVLAGPDRIFDGRYRNPLSLLVLANQYGAGDGGSNVMVGFDVRWRLARAIRLLAQVAIDDIQYQNRSGPDRYPDRYAFTLSALGPLGGRAAWQATYTQVSALAYRTQNADQNYVDAGIGLGRNFTDNDQLTVTATVPVAGRWLVTPEATLLRQGEGTIDAPFPQTGAEAGQIPQLFIGTVERTWRVALGLTGRQGPIDLTGNIGFHHIVNALHQPGMTRDRVEARVKATVGLGRRGILH